MSNRVPGRSWRARAAAFAAAGLLAACSALEPPEREGALVFATLPEAETLHLPDGTAGPGFTEELAGEFAASLGVPLRVLRVESAEQLEQTLHQGRAHLGAYLNPRPVPQGILFSQPILSLPLWVVTHGDREPPTALTELVEETVHVIAGSPAELALQSLPEGSRPRLESHAALQPQALLSRLAERQIEFAAVNELNLRIAASTHPELTPAIRLFGQAELSLALPRMWGKGFQDALDAFLAEAQASNALRRLYDKHYGHIQRVGPDLLGRFLADTRSVLPKFRSEFKRAQELTGLDWRLLAALAYQESKWDPNATSATNVRGIMMLTEDTADHLNVANRLDPAQSIRGGAIYLRQLMDQLPPSIAETDRLWFALAAYNLGMGHLNGGRAIAESQGRDPDSWYDMKAVLPQLARPEIYNRLKSGRARGGEAVILVENVRSLFGVLTRIEAPHQPLLSGDELRRQAQTPRGTGLKPGASAPALRPPAQAGRSSSAPT